jgi:hypothetical protein
VLLARCKLKKRKGNVFALRRPMWAAYMRVGGMGALPGASRSAGILKDSSFLGVGRWGGCFQMSGSCSRGWYTESSEPSSLPLLHTVMTL